MPRRCEMRTVEARRGSRELQRTCADNDYQPHSGSEVDGRATIRLPCNRRAGLFGHGGGHRHSVLCWLPCCCRMRMPFAPICVDGRLPSAFKAKKDWSARRISVPGSPLFGKALTGRVEILAGRWSAPRSPPPRSSRRKPPAHPDTSQKRKRAGQHDSLSGPTHGHPAGQPPRPSPDRAPKSLPQFLCV